MGTISNARAIYGLNATGVPTSTNVDGVVTIGVGQDQKLFPDADVAYSVRAILAPDAVFQIVADDGDTSLSDAWVAGVAQVETATAAGTITLAGNASVTVTADGMTGSPKTISVAVALNDTAATWAGKVRTALAADADVSELFTVSGTTTAIVLTRKPIATVSGVNMYADNDSTLNVALDNGTCTGITTAATSANTTAGVATEGCTIYDGDGKDFEGVTLPTLATLYAILATVTPQDPVFGIERIEVDANSSGTLNGCSIKTSGTCPAYMNAIFENGVSDEPTTVVATSTGAKGEITITIIGKTA